MVARELKDKYIHRFGYPKKIVIDDVLSTYLKDKSEALGPNDFKDLDIIMKKRIMGREKKAEEEKKPAFGGSKSVEKIKQTPKPNKNAKAEPEVKEVTGKITNEPAPKVKRPRKKAVEKSAEPSFMKKEETSGQAAALEKLVVGTSQPSVKKSLNSWNMLDRFRSQEYEQQVASKKEAKKVQVNEYKQMLDSQVAEKSKLSKMDSLEKQSVGLRNNPGKIGLKLNPEEMLKEYSSLETDLKNSHVFGERGTKRLIQT